MFFNKNKEKETPISKSRISVIPQSNLEIRPSYTKESNFLTSLSNESNTMKAIEMILDKTSDGKMAVNTYLRLANQGMKVDWYNTNTNKKTKKYDQLSDDFCSKVGKNNNGGLDGLVDQLHYSAIARGGMACEIVVAKGAKEIDDVVMVDPITFTEFKWLPAENRYAIYQEQTGGKKIDLYEGNFYYIPHQPKVGRPDGSLQFEPAIMATEQFYKLLKDSFTVLERIGYPRYDFSIDVKKFIEALPNKSEEAIKKAIKDHFALVEQYARKMQSGSDFVHTDDTSVNVVGGGVNGSGVDIRAWFEVIEPLVINGYQLTPVLMGRLKGGSYSLGSVEFKIVTDTVDSMRRSSKRMLEDILKFWARVNGFNIYPKVTQNPIDWEKALEILNVALKKAELNRKGEEYGWISKDEAAMDSLGAEKADNTNSDGKYQYLKGKATADVLDEPEPEPEPVPEPKK